MNPIGRKRWAIAEGYIPPQSHGPEPEMTSHLTAGAIVFSTLLSLVPLVIVTWAAGS